jgi:phosphatidylglycerol:prolipoprotein diacylglycerol transferase
MVHSMDPFIIEFGSSGIGIRWYGMAYLAGFIASYFVIKYMAEKKTIKLKPDQVGDYVTFCAIGTMIGGRLGYVLFYKPHTFLEFTSSFPFWEVLAVHKGGMASHGGIAGIFITCLWLGRKFGVNKLRMIDLASLMGGVGIFFGRIANFINGELFGRVAPESFNWAVKFPTELHYWMSYQTHKLKQLGPVVANMGEVNLSQIKTKLDADAWADLVSSMNFSARARYDVSQVIDQIILLTQQGNEKVLMALEPILSPRYPSQLYQAMMEGFFVFLICFVVWLRPRKPGVIAGVFGLSYSVARILGEQFRMPDAHIGYDFLGLTRGQWLSVGMLLFSLGFLIYSLRRDSEPSGGFSKQAIQKELTH